MNIYYQTIDFKGIGPHMITVWYDEDEDPKPTKIEHEAWCIRNAKDRYKIRDGRDAVCIFFEDKHLAIQFKLVFA
ncbi:hypothetical protein D3C87_666470 [compost metagenome]